MAAITSSAKAPQYTLTWDGFDVDVNKLAQLIEPHKDKYSYLYPIKRGGLAIALSLSHRLGIPIEYYLPINGKTLVVDDVSDSGNTLEAYCKWGPIDKNPAFVCDSATLHRKDGTIWEPTYTARTINAHIVYPWEV